MSEGEKVLGIDFGEKRVGLAITAGQLAEPFSIVEVSGPPSLKLRGAVQQIVKVCQQEKIEKIVLGLPPGSRKVKNFGRELAEETGLKVIFWDETLTSEEALAKMIQAGRPRRKRRRLDDVVAAMILQEYLDSQL